MVRLLANILMRWEQIITLFQSGSLVWKNAPFNVSRVEDKLLLYSHLEVSYEKTLHLTFHTLRTNYYFIPITLHQSIVYYSKLFTTITHTISIIFKSWHTNDPKSKAYAWMMIQKKKHH